MKLKYINQLNEEFVHLHTHDEYSNIRILDSINKIKNMVLYANKLGNKGMAITNHECISNHVKFLKTVDELIKKEKISTDFKPILGNEIYLVDEEQMNFEMRELGRTQFYHFILLAKNNLGHEQLRRLSECAWRRMFSYKGIERVPTFYSDIEDIIGNEKGNLIASTACLGGLFPNFILQLINSEDEDEKECIKDKIHNFLCWGLDTFGEGNFYIELQPSLQEEQIAFNKMAVNIAKAYGLDWIITTDAHYLKSEDREIHKAFLTSEDDENNNREVDNFYSTTHFFTTEQIFENMSYLDDKDIESGILNTQKILNQIEGYDFFRESEIPLTKLPKENEWYPINYSLEKYQYISEMLNSNEEQHRYLIHQIFRGIDERQVPDNKINEYLERVNIECKEIIGASEAKHQPMGAYLITMQKNVDIIWEEAESIVGAGRGSANGYIIDYFLEITQVNPLEQGVEMPHWRFMSAERPDIFDIDIDFSSHKKDIVLDKITKYYQSIGGDVVRVATFGTETSKSAVQTGARGLKINNDVALYLSSLIPVERGKVWSISDCYYGNPNKNRQSITEFKNMIDEYSDKGLLQVVLGIEGLINKRSSHACFDQDTLITTFKGLKRIVDVKIGDNVLTHNGRFKPVIDTIITHTEEEYEIKTSASYKVNVTGNHPFYVRERLDKKNKKSLNKPHWKQASELRPYVDYIGIPINHESKIPNNILHNVTNKNFWWVIGRYIGDGWTECYNRNRNNRNSWVEKRLIICCSNKDETEKEEITEKLIDLKIPYRIEKVRTTYKIHIKDLVLYEYLQSYGRYASGKYINEDIFNLPKDYIEAFLDGYISADGHYNYEKENYSVKTVSKQLAIGVMQLINKTYNTHAHIAITPAKIEYIEGRKVNSKEKYNITFSKQIKNKEHSFYEDGYIWTPVTKMNLAKVNKNMYNLTVLDDSSYVANGLAVHNCGVIISNGAITEHNSVMRTPSGELISAYELHDSEAVSNLKYDFLNTKTQSMIQLTLEMLIKNSKMQWQGSLRKTYNKYLHPDVIDKITKEMWDILCQGQLLSAFQFESNVGEQAIKLIQPHNLIDASNGNTVMRLMVDTDEQPLEKFVRYKNDINEWYKDMIAFGLKPEQIKILEKHLLQDNGVCSSQERMMLLTMDEDIAKFGVIESNKLRKGCAKKLPEEIEKAKQLFFDYGQKLNTPQILLDYIWNEQISMQLGYGFSILHAVAYTIILIQQLNLVYYYPPIYWNTSVLLVESGAIEREQVDDAEFDIKEKTTNYGEIAKAIGKLQSKEITISLPNINIAEQGFIPNEKDNAIIFGLKGIMKINNETSKIIMENRPYTSLQDFHERLVLVKREVILSTGKTQMKSLVSESQTIMLIKAGAFDNIETDSREEILEKYLHILNPPKLKLNSKDIGKIAEMGILNNELKDELKYYNFRDFLTSMSKIQDTETKGISWHKIQDDNDIEYINNFFLTNFAIDMQEGRDYKYDEDGCILVALGTKRKGSFEAIYNTKISNLLQWLTTEDCIMTYNNIIFESIKNKEMQGNISRWEMESMNYYYHEHELANVNKEKYGIVDFNELAEEPEIVGFTKYKGLNYPKFKLERIIGTVLDRDKNKHSVSILTPSGVVTLKFYSGQFNFYDKTISQDNGLNSKGKLTKTILENGWFQRGTRLLVTGIRKGDVFKPKRYSNSIYQHTLALIESVSEEGDLLLKTDRVQVVE